MEPDAPIETARLRLVVMPRAVLAALGGGDVDAAGAALGCHIGGEWPGRAEFMLDLRMRQLDGDPAVGSWLVRAMVRRADDEMVGYIGFHDRPDDTGTVEVGYTVLAPYRRQGFATEALDAMLAWARHRHVRTIRASVRPDNVPSLAIVRRFGLQRVGEQIDERDGLELVFERRLPE